MAKIETIEVWRKSDGVKVVINSFDFDPARHSKRKPRRGKNGKRS